MPDCNVAWSGVARRWPEFGSALCFPGSDASIATHTHHPPLQVCRHRVQGALQFWEQGYLQDQATLCPPGSAKSTLNAPSHSPPHLCLPPRNAAPHLHPIPGPALQVLLPLFRRAPGRVLPAVHPALFGWAAWDGWLACCRHPRALKQHVRAGLRFANPLPLAACDPSSLPAPHMSSSGPGAGCGPHISVRHGFFHRRGVHGGGAGRRHGAGHRAADDERGHLLHRRSVPARR